MRLEKLELVTKIEMGDTKIGQMLKKNEMGGPQAGKLMKKAETGGMKVGELVKRIQMKELKVGKVGRSAIFGQEVYTKPAQAAMLAEAGEVDEFIKCFDDITGKELPWQAVKEAREKELTYLRERGVYGKVDERTGVAKYNVTPVDTKWVDTDKAFEGKPMLIRFTNCCQRVQKW